MDCKFRYFFAEMQIKLLLLYCDLDLFYYLYPMNSFNLNLQEG
jgi:hypothetical protein